MENINSYRDFAEADKNSILKLYDIGERSNLIVSTASTICERYLKDIINKYYVPTNAAELNQEQGVLHSHNLRSIVGFLQNNMGINISEELRALIERIDGIYFQTRYPGASSFFVDDRDCEIAVRTIRLCCEETLNIENLILNERQQEESLDNNFLDL